MHTSTDVILNDLNDVSVNMKGEFVVSPSNSSSKNRKNSLIKLSSTDNIPDNAGRKESSPTTSIDNLKANESKNIQRTYTPSFAEYKDNKFSQTSIKRAFKRLDEDNEKEKWKQIFTKSQDKAYPFVKDIGMIEFGVWDTRMFKKVARGLGFHKRDIEDFLDPTEVRENVEFRKGCFLMTFYIRTDALRDADFRLSFAGTHKKQLLEKLKQDQKEGRWVRVCLGMKIRRQRLDDIHTLVLCREDSIDMVDKLTVPFGADFKVTCSNYVYRCVEIAEESMRKYGKLLFKRVLLKQEQLGKKFTRNYGCCKSTNWPLPKDVHGYIDEVLDLESEVANFRNT
eukprot:UN25175